MRNQREVPKQMSKISVTLFLFSIAYHIIVTTDMNDKEENYNTIDKNN